MEAPDTGLHEIVKPISILIRKQHQTPVTEQKCTVAPTCMSKNQYTNSAETSYT